ncbi:MAG TPA: helix-turn-helix transcriptional regulator [Thermoanaerobaculia bacterium]|nr:helix-turn-helix transcriptional regulator [Thermoanaerobaculia bacterium]
MQLLARLMRLSGMSTRVIGEKIGVRSSAISKILNGYTRPHAWHLVAIAAAIGLTPREFFSRAYPAEKQTDTHPLGRNSAELERMVEAAVRRSLLQGLGS